jgi:hypothetical protein
MSIPIRQNNTRVNTATTTVIKNSRGRLLGFYVSSTTGGTLVVHDHASAASNAVTGTITPAVGFHNLQLNCRAGIVVVSANTIDVVFYWQ